MLVIGAGIYKMLVRIANRTDYDHIASEELRNDQTASEEAV